MGLPNQGNAIDLKEKKKKKKGNVLASSLNDSATSPCLTRSHLQQLVAAEQLAAAADGPLWKDGADVVVAAVCFQTDAQAAALTELLHLSHLSGEGRQDAVGEMTRQLFKASGLCDYGGTRYVLDDSIQFWFRGQQSNFS